MGYLGNGKIPFNLRVKFTIEFLMEGNSPKSFLNDFRVDVSIFFLDSI